MRKVLLKTVLVGTAGAGLAFSGLTAATASASPAVVFVSPIGTSGGAGWSCATAEFRGIQAAVEAAPTGSTVVVCKGTYIGGLTVDKRVNLAGEPGATIDATGKIYGIGVATSGVSVTGLTVENANSATNGAPDDGIITAGFVKGVPTPANHVTIAHNVTTGNLGAGIDLNSSSYDVAIDNRSVNNGIGINLSNDLGLPASHDQVTNNVASDNPGGCGIVLADHSGVGVFDNLILGNHSDDNGLGSSTAPDGTSGSGIILATGVGSVYNNDVVSNEFSGNGHAGVALHAHVPGQNFSGNVVSYNRIGTNNVLGDYADSETSGVYLGDASPLTITVTGNIISNDHYGIFTAGTVTVQGAQHNLFLGVAVPTGGVPTYSG